MDLNARELETVLCALRAWQTALEEDRAFPHMSLEYALLSTDEVDELCERINCAPVAPVDREG